MRNLTMRGILLFLSICLMLQMQIESNFVEEIKEGAYFIKEIKESGKELIEISKELCLNSNDCLGFFRYKNLCCKLMCCSMFEFINENP